MNSCRTCRGQMSEALYDELKPASRAEFDEHLAACARCAAEFAEFREVRRVLDLRTAPRPSDAFWDQFWPDLLAGMRRPVQLQQPRFRWLSSRPWVWKMAAAAALIVIGAFVDRYFFTPSVPQPELPAGPAAGGAPNLDNRIDRYLERSKLVLWSVNNLKLPGGSRAESVDLSSERRLARSLLLEGRALEKDLRSSREDDLLELMSQLEVILLQIANVRDSGIPLGIELARTGIQDGALLFQINLEEMRRASERTIKAKRAGEASKRRVG